MSAEAILHHLLEADDDDLKDIMLPDWQDDLKYLRQKFADGKVAQTVAIFPDGGIVIVFTDGSDWESKLAHTEINYMLQSWPSLQNVEVIRCPKEEPKGNEWQQEALDDDFEMKEVVHMSAPEPVKAKYGGHEIRYGPFKLHWYDYPDGSRIVSLYYLMNFDLHSRKSRKTGETHIVRTNKLNWSSGPLVKLEAGWEKNWDRWLQRAFAILDKYPEGAWAARRIPSLPEPSGEVWDERSRGISFPPFEDDELEESEEEDDWKELTHPNEWATVDSWLARYMPPLGFKYQDMGVRGWEKTVGDTQVSLGASTKPNTTLMVRYRRYAGTRWQNEEMESVPLGEPVFQKLREWGVIK